MTFDKSKVYTALNADEVKVGSKGFFACNVKALKEAVLADDIVVFGEVEEIFDEFASCRFGIKDDAGYALFYLVEEPKEEKYRPYKDTDEMIEDFKKRYNSYVDWSGKNNPMYNPLIWIKAKDIEKNKYLITRFSEADKLTVNFEYKPYTFNLYVLINNYTYLDGSPCGIKE